MNNFFLASVSLLRREIVRFLRQRQRIIGALGTPLLFWVLLGSGMGGMKVFFPGTVSMILLFTAIFSTISIIEDRREGFLQGVLVSPTPRSAIVMGKVLGGTALAAGQGLLFVALSPLVGIHMSWLDFLYVLAVIITISFALTGLGFIIAWRLDSTQGFHAIMNLFLMPMWFLSGSLFPLANAPAWLRAVMLINPLTYGVAALQQGFFHPLIHTPGVLGSKTLCLLIISVSALVTFTLSAQAVTKDKTSA